MNTIQKVENPNGRPEPTYSGPTYAPSVDIIDLPNEMQLVADVPGANADGIDVHFDRGLLTIHARIEPRRDPEASYLLREYGVGDFHRTFEIGDVIDSNAIHAEVASGVLTVHLPKREAAKTRRIKVKSAS